MSTRPVSKMYPIYRPTYNALKATLNLFITRSLWPLSGIELRQIELRMDELAAQKSGDGDGVRIKIGKGSK